MSSILHLIGSRGSRAGLGWGGVGSWGVVAAVGEGLKPCTVDAIIKRKKGRSCGTASIRHRGAAVRGRGRWVASSDLGCGVQGGGRGVPPVPSQVDFPLGGLAGGGGGRVVLHPLAQGDLLPPTVFTGRVSAPRVGTAVGRHEPHVGHFGAAARPALLRRQGLGAAVGHQLLLPVHLLVRHKGGELGGALGHPAVGGRLAGHPAGVRVSELGALVGAVTGHRHVGEGPEVCNQKERERERDGG